MLAVVIGWAGEDKFECFWLEYTTCDVKVDIVILGTVEASGDEK